MLFAIGAAGSLVDALASLTSSQSSSGPTSANPGQGSTNPFDLGTSAQGQISSGFSAGSAGPTISPQTLNALIEAQSQAGTTNAAPTDPSAALKDLFSQIDGNGDGAITKQEFEAALGAGGTNIAAADDVFGKLDTNGDGSVSLDELKSALQGAGHHGHHHMHADGADDSNGATGADGSSDPVMQALEGASSTSVANSDGSTTTSITYADGSKVTLTTPAASASSSAGAATSSYNWIEQMIQREAKALSTSLASSVSVNA